MSRPIETSGRKKVPGQPKLPETIVKSQQAASEALGVSAKTIRRWKVEGGEGAGFLADGAIDLGILGSWCEERRRQREGSKELKEALIRQQIRRLKLANDLKEGRLIERAWMAERLMIAVGRVDAYRIRSEAEHPLRFAAAAGDVAACREVIQEIWNEIMAAHHECQDAFAELPKSQ